MSAESYRSAAASSAYIVVVVVVADAADADVAVVGGDAAAHVVGHAAWAWRR